jgi:small subunit ribosomal protein S16
MLKIRLQRVGRKHEPSFRLVLTDSKNSTKSGRFGEILGSYDPRKTTEFFKADRIKHWLSQGAGATATVNNLLIRKGILRGKKIDVSAGEAPVATPVPVVEPVAEPVVEEVIAPVVEEIAPAIEESAPVIE